MKKRILIPTIICVVIAGIMTYAHFDFYAISKKRLALTETYPEMKEDSFHHYINFQIDYKDASRGQFRGFYLLSPYFYKSENITFLLTDGQMELVSTETDFTFFEGVLGQSSYVLIGVRGHSPTLLPEVYKNGDVDYDEAINLYNSDQQIEDIEQVRLDLIKKGILSKNSKINIYGASGAGILAQQYISKYGKNVHRVILESTGAPDLAKKLNLNYSPNFKDFNPKADRILSTLFKENQSDKSSLCYILYQQGRTEKSPKEAQLKTVEEIKKGGWMLKYKFKPMTNLTVLNYIVKSPQSISARIRWFELVGSDLIQYKGKKEVNLLYEFSSTAISDVLDFHKTKNILPKQFNINRDFPGEVLILKGTEDVVFGDTINKEIQKSYANSQLLFFKDGHRMQKVKAKYMKIRIDFLNNGFKKNKEK